MTRKLGATPGPSRTRVEPSKVMADINTLQNELSRFNASLPDELKLNDQNVTRYMASEEGPGYVFLHTCLGSSHLDLYSLSLPGLREQISVDILRKLPREFISKSQKQAIAHALCLARFCDTIQREVDQRPGTGRLKLAGDPSILNVTNQVLRVLLTALQHHFYQDLADHTTAPLWRSEPADEAHIRNLIDSLLRISESWCRIIPKARHYVSPNTPIDQRSKLTGFSMTATELRLNSLTEHGSLLIRRHMVDLNLFRPPAADDYQDLITSSRTLLWTQHETNKEVKLEMPLPPTDGFVLLNHPTNLLPTLSPEANLISSTVLLAFRCSSPRLEACRWLRPITRTYTMPQMIFSQCPAR